MLRFTVNLQSQNVLCVIQVSVKKSQWYSDIFYNEIIIIFLVNGFYDSFFVQNEIQLRESLS